MRGLAARPGDRPPPGPGGRMSFEKPKNAKKVISRLLGYLKARRLTLLLVVVLVLLSSASMLAGNYFLKPLINNYILPGDFPGLARGLLTLAGIYLVGVAASYSQSRLMINVAQRTSNTLRRELFIKMQSLPLSYFDGHTHGELMSRYTNDIDNVQMAFEQSLVQLISSAISFVGAIVLMLTLSPILFLVTLAFLAIMLFVIGKIGGKSRNYFIAQQQNLGNVNGYVEELVDGLKVVKVFGYEDSAIAEFGKRNEAYRQAATNANFFAAVVFPIMGNLNGIAYAATALVGGMLAVWGRFDIGSLAAYLQYTRQMGMPVQMMSNQLNTLLAALAGAERVFEVMDQAPEVDEGRVELVGATVGADGAIVPSPDSAHPTHWAWYCPQAAGLPLNPAEAGNSSVERLAAKREPEGLPAYTELKGDVRFHNVTFGYVPDKKVLHDVSLYAKPGQKIAFVGSTGAGKTTVTNLINRFYEIEQGSITFDGIDIRYIAKDSLRNSIGMVLQDTHLFTGTVMDNIRYGRLDATDEECITAAMQANAHSFIRRLPQGYDTKILADGANLSQGQRQLLAIARTAVADPPVLILDEATSSIDTRTEQLIQKGLDELMRDRTVFVIAHRLSTVRSANAILVIEDGRIIERGDHDDLLAQRGRYYQLYTGQFELD
jgi:ATP-binding cassette subfamily B multidrug efflux pump